MSWLPGASFSAPWLLALVLFVACGETAESTAPLDPPDQLGAFAVGHIAFIAVDQARNDRELPVDVWYPTDHSSADAFSPTKYPRAGAIGLEPGRRETQCARGSAVSTNSRRPMSCAAP